MIENIDWWICTDRFAVITNVDNLDTTDKSTQIPHFVYIDWLDVAYSYVDSISAIFRQRKGLATYRNECGMCQWL